MVDFDEEIKKQKETLPKLMIDFHVGLLIFCIGIFGTIFVISLFDLFQRASVFGLYWFLCFYTVMILYIKLGHKYGRLNLDMHNSKTNLINESKTFTKQQKELLLEGKPITLSKCWCCGNPRILSLDEGGFEEECKGKKAKIGACMWWDLCRGRWVMFQPPNAPCKKYKTLY